jgi:hypothetical protein
MVDERWQELAFRCAPFLAALRFVAVAVLRPDSGSDAVADRPTRAVAAPGAGGMTLVVGETESRGWCKRFRRDVAPGYQEPTYAARAVAQH